MSNVFKTLATVDRRVWHAVTFILVSYLLLFPAGLPLSVTAEVQEVYDMIEALEPGDVVLINFDIAAYGWDELKGQALSVVPHVLEQEGVKVMFMTDQDQGVIFIERVLSSVGTLMSSHSSAPWYEINGKQYLEGYVVLGYFPGQENAFAALGNDFRKNVGDNDWYGNDISGWLDDAGVVDAGDITLAISFDCESGATYLARHFYLSYGTPIIAGEIGVNVPVALTNYNAGLFKGILKSTRAAAEYQYISGYKGMALVSMDAYSAIHILLLLIIVLGNLGYYGWEKKEKGGN